MILLFFFGSLYLSSSWWWEPHKCGSVSSDHWGGWIGGFGPFFQNAHFVYVINIVKTLWVRKITMFRVFWLQNNPILSGMVIFQNWGAPLIFGARSTLNWTWKSSSLKINYFGRFLLRQKMTRISQIWPWQMLRQRGSPPHTQSYHHINRDTGTYSYVHIAYKILWQRKHKTYGAEYWIAKAW